MTCWQFGWGKLTNPQSRPAAPLCTILLIGALLCLQWAAPQARADTHFKQRSDYLKAREHLRRGQIGDYRRVAASLRDYPLHPYLEYHRLRNRLSAVPTREVVAFLTDHAELPVAPLLRKRWLRELGKRRQWSTLRKHYRTTSDAEINCYHLRALYGTGERQQALDETTRMWLQPVSQPKACDPLFEVWRDTDRFTEGVVWQRLTAAIGANERSLARYLLRYLSGHNKAMGEAFYAVHTNPERITRTSQYPTDNGRYRQIIAHGLTRLARRDAKKAAKAWRKYRGSHDFDASTTSRLDGLVALALAQQDNLFPDSDNRVRYKQPDLIEDLADAAVTGRNWPEAVYWIDQLPQDLKLKSRWLYWSARALEETQGANPDSTSRYARLSGLRHYYGFLAARRLGLPGQMNAHNLRQVSSVDLQRVQRIPGITRSIELFAVSDDINGRREWFQALRNMPAKQQILAAELARHLGLISMAIRTANIAEANDHLHLRFPLAYEPLFRRASMKTAVPVPLLMAIARQESAMEAAARSSADARGLMQLLPSTARLVARRTRQRVPAAAELYDPGMNINIGSYHLAWLIERFGGQAPLAIAAYNAGEHRVDRWIADAEGMPMDVWIETIPFLETRNYVKNVLAFRHVYADELDLPAPLLSPLEQQISAR